MPSLDQSFQSLLLVPVRLRRADLEPSSVQAQVETALDLCSQGRIVPLFHHDVVVLGTPAVRDQTEHPRELSALLDDIVIPRKDVRGSGTQLFSTMRIERDTSDR